MISVEYMLAVIDRITNVQNLYLAEQTKHSINYNKQIVCKYGIKGKIYRGVERYATNTPSR